MVALGALIHQAKTIRCGDGDYPVLSMTMHDGLVFQDEKFKKVIASNDRTDYKIVKRNQLVISFPIDEGVLAAQRIVDAGIVSPAYGIWDIDHGKILPEFLEYALRCDRALSYYKAKLRGSTARRRSLPTPTLLAYTVPLPAVSEQKHILDVIHKVKGVISGYAEQIILLNNLIKARFVEMFESCSCDTVKAGSLFQTIRNGVSPSIHGTYTAKVLTLSAITQGAFDKSAWKNGMFDEPPADDKRVNKTDLYICRGNGNKALVGTAAYSKHDYPDLVFPDTIIAASVDTSKIRLPYLFYAWKHPTVRMQIESGARTTNGTFKVNQKTLSEIEVMLPPLELQEQFAAFVEQTDKSKVAVQKALEEAQLLFDGLMQDYFG